MTKEYLRGERAAKEFLDGCPSVDDVKRQYGFSRAAPDQTDFDRAWQKELRAALGEQQ